ncbi:hypothetical protein HOF92_02400 [bacterium]|jgi:CRP-like cAMP-binding protein|nr:hypothetical protein [bacterium]
MSINSYTERFYEPEEYVCLQGEEPEDFYRLVEGELEVLLTDEAFLKDCASQKERLEKVNEHGRVIARLSEP